LLACFVYSPDVLSLPARRASDLQCGARVLQSEPSVDLGGQLALGVAQVHAFQRDRLDLRGIAGSAEGFVAGDADVTHGLLRSLRSEEHTSELQSRENLVCRLLPE